MATEMFAFWYICALRYLFNDLAFDHDNLNINRRRVKYTPEIHKSRKYPQTENHLDVVHTLPNARLNLK